MSKQLPTVLDHRGEPIKFSAPDDRDEKYPPPSDDWWFGDAFESGRKTKATPSTAQRIVAAYACIDVLAKTCAMLPGNVFLPSPSGAKELQSKHPLFNVLRRPNKIMDRFQFWQLKERTQLLQGNFYAQRIFNRNRDLIELRPIHPDLVKPRQAKEGEWIESNYEVVYDIRTASGKTVTLHQSEMFHTKEPGEDGIIGRSRITIAAAALELALDLLGHNKALIENDSRPLGLLIPTAPIRDKDQKEKLRDSWEETHRGPRKSGRVAVLPFGVEYKQISMTARDAQILEMMQFSSLDQVATLFDVPPYRIQDFRRATFSNVEQSDLFWGKNSIQPRVTATECAIEAQLISQERDPELFVRFNLDAMFRADIKTRYESHRMGIQDGWLSRNEVRVIEDMNPSLDESLNECIVPENYTTSQGLTLKVRKLTAEVKKLETEPVPAPEEAAPLPTNDNEEALSKQLKDQVSRLVTKECRAVKKALRKEDWKSECEAFYSKHKIHFEQSIAPIIDGYVELTKLNIDSATVISRISHKFLTARADAVVKSVKVSAVDVVSRAVDQWMTDEEIQKVIDLICEEVKNGKNSTV